jgi:SAM-dependent methyltransferase
MTTRETKSPKTPRKPKAPPKPAPAPEPASEPEDDAPTAEAVRRDAWIYELIHRGHRGDKLFYRRVCRGAERVLELGCGYGRLLLPIAEVAREVVGVETHPGLVERLEARIAALPPERAARVAVARQDMRGPLPAGPFDRVVIPYNGLFCLPSEADQIACLAAARAVVTPGGRLFFDAYVIDEESLTPGEVGAEPIADEYEHVLTVLAPEGQFDIYEQNVEYPGAQRIDAHFRVVLSDEEGGETVFAHSVEHRFLLPTQIEPVLAAAGWRLTSLAGGWRGARFGRRSALMVVEAEPA